MKTILILSQYYYPDISATGQVLTQLTEDITNKHGNKVKVLTGQPAYHRDSDDVSPYKETINNVEIIRIKYLRLNKKTKLGRLVGFFSFFIAILIKIPFIGAFETILIVSNPPMLPIIGHFLKKAKRINFIYLLHDLYPDVALRMGVTHEQSMMTKVMNWINKKVFKSADHIVVLGRDAKKLIVDKGVESSKVKIITNWADKLVIDKESNTDMLNKLNIEGKFVVLYTGNIGLIYDLEYIIESFGNVKDLHNICLIMIGEGNNKENLKKIVQDKEIPNIYFYPYQPQEEYGQLLKSADVLLVALAHGMEGISIPSKSYGYMAAEKPLLGILPENSEIGMVIEENNCGLQVNPRDIQGIELALRTLYGNPDLRQSMGTNSRKVFEEKYQREYVTAKFNELL